MSIFRFRLEAPLRRVAQAYSAVPSSSQVDIHRAESIQRRSTKPLDDESAEDTVHAEHEIHDAALPDDTPQAEKVGGRETPARKESLVNKLARVLSTNLEHKPLADPPHAVEGLKLIITGSCTSYMSRL